MKRETTAADTVLNQVMARDEQYFMPVFGKRMPLCMVSGHGAYLTDSAGKNYLDMIGGIAVNVLGHAHPRLTEAICEQAGKLIHCSNYYYNEPQALACRTSGKKIEAAGCARFFSATAVQRSMKRRSS